MWKWQFLQGHGHNFLEKYIERTSCRVPTFPEPTGPITASSSPFEKITNKKLIKSNKAPLKQLGQNSELTGATSKLRLLRVGSCSWNLKQNEPNLENITKILIKKVLVLYTYNEVKVLIIIKTKQN